MLQFQIEKLKRLPQQVDDIWQGCIARLPIVVDDDAGSSNPEIPVWISLKADKLGPSADSYQPGNSPFQTLLNSLVAFACDRKFMGYRPGKLEVGDAALAGQLAEVLAEADINVEYVDEPVELQNALNAFYDVLNRGRQIPGPMDETDVSLARFRAFAGAAKEFYKAAPWRHLMSEDILEIESPQGEPSMRFAVVMGAAGQEFGLGFYETIDLFWKVQEGESAENLLKIGPFWCMSYQAAHELPPADAELWLENRLPVCREKLYPMLIRHDLKQPPTRANSAILTYVEGLMRALSATTEEQMDAGRWTISVKTFDGPTEYTLSLPFMINPPARHELLRLGIMPDSRAIEASTAQVNRFLEGKDFAGVDEVNKALAKEFVNKAVDRAKHPPRTPLEQAQDLCYQAFESFGRRRLALARQALKISPDCADAYVIMAEATGNLCEKMKLYTKGVEAGRRALGEAPFKEEVGRFWGNIRNRPFMRAMMGMAEAQAQDGGFDAAIANYRVLLQWNPDDNQGARYMLLPLLLETGQDQSAAELLETYPEELAAIWLYCRALLTFREQGESKEANEKLVAAFKQNRHVPKYLLKLEIAEYLPDSYAFGSEEEAIIATVESGDAWEATPGAMIWLDDRFRAFRRATRSKKPKSKSKKNRRKNRSR